MAATTITRTSLTLTNDTGTASNPDANGTLLNAALWTLLLDRIDALLSGALTVGGVISSEGFGSHNFSSGGTGGNIFTTKNTTAGTGNFAQIGASNNSSLSVFLRMLSSTYTTSSYYVQGGGVLESNGAGGLSIVTSHASGTLRLYTNGTLRATWGTAGELTHTNGLYLSGEFNQSVTGNTELSGSAATTVLCRITSAASTPVITGANGAAGQFLMIKNVSGAAVTLAHQSTASSPALRFVCPGNANIGIDDGDGVMAIYNASDSRWYVFGI